MSAFSDLVKTVAKLRSPEGCPWDREQTPQSLRQYMIEEAYEVVEVLDRIFDPKDIKKERNLNELKEELGDVWLQVLLHSEIAKEVGAFDIEDVANTLNEKLIRRHPHVFGDAVAKTGSEAFANWEAQKAKEKKAKKEQTSVLDGLPSALPALQRAARMIDKAARVGFIWDDLQGPLQKIREELQELEAEMPRANSDRLRDELGDLLFAVCNLAYMLKVEPEDALKTTQKRFESRFRYIEKKLEAMGKSPKDSTLEEMDLLWDQAKKAENGN